MRLESIKRDPRFTWCVFCDKMIVKDLAFVNCKCRRVFHLCCINLQKLYQCPSCKAQKLNNIVTFPMQTPVPPHLTVTVMRTLKIAPTQTVKEIIQPLIEMLQFDSNAVEEDVQKQCKISVIELNMCTRALRYKKVQ